MTNKYIKTVKELTICTTSIWPWAAARCKGVSSPIFVVFTRAPRPIITKVKKTPKYITFKNSLLYVNLFKKEVCADSRGGGGGGGREVSGEKKTLYRCHYNLMLFCLYCVFVYWSNIEFLIIKIKPPSPYSSVSSLSMLKGTVRIISSDPVCKEGNSRFSTLKPFIVNWVEISFCWKISKPAWISLKRECAGTFNIWAGNFWIVDNGIKA